MTNFNYDTGDQIYQGGADNDRFTIFGPSDTNEIYRVIANGRDGNDTLIHIDLDQINITFNAGTGRDLTEILFGNAASNFNLNMGDGNDQVILGSASYEAKGNFNISLGTGQDEVIMFDLESEIIISDFETGNTGDRFILSNQIIYDLLANSVSPFHDGTLTLTQDAADTLLTVQDGNQDIQSIVFRNTNVGDFTSFNFAGLNFSEGETLDATYVVTAADYEFGSNFFASLGDDTITVEEGVSQFVDIHGLAGNDVLNGNSGNNRLYGGAGDDILNGNEGNDTLNYEVGGNDHLNGGAGDDTFRVSNSEINGQAGRFEITLDGGEGNDRLIHIDRASHDIEFIGGNGQDKAEVWASSESSNFIFDMGMGNDVVQIGSDSSNVFSRGGEGGYTITLGGGSDEVLLNSVGISFSTVSSPPPTQILITDFETGPSGDLITLNFSGQIGNWNEEGENPFDLGAARIVQRGEDAVLQFEKYENSSSRTAIAWSDVIVFENVDFLDFTAENFNGLSIENALLDPTFRGTSQNDLLTGRDSDDILLGEGGNDTLIGGLGNDILEGGAGRDMLDGGAGVDTADYGSATNRVNVNLLSGEGSSNQAQGDTYISIEDIAGSNFGDTLRGNNSNNTIDGRSGNDVLIGFNGNDVILGGDGRDILNGGNGADIIDGGSGVDQARYNGSTDAVQINLLDGTATGGQADGDVLIGIENLFGSNHDDVLFGDQNNNQLYGHNGDDELAGNGGISKLFGGAGADTFVLSDGFSFAMDFVDDVDQLDVSAYGFASLTEAIQNLDQVGQHARFRYEGDVLFVLNTDVADLMDDIIF